MTPDIQILSIVQIALIGILVVLGMFFLWRKIQRLEQKLESVSGQMEHLLSPAFSASPTSGASPASGASPTSGASLAPGASKGASPAFSASPACPFSLGATSSPTMEEDGDEFDFDDEDDEGEADGEMFGLNPEEEAIVQRIFQEGGSVNMGGNGASAAFMVFSPFGFNSTPPATQSNPPVVQIEEEGDVEVDAETESSVRLPSKTKLSKMNIEQLKDYLSQHQLSTDGTKKQLFERALETIR